MLHQFWTSWLRVITFNLQGNWFTQTAHWWNRRYNDIPLTKKDVVELLGKADTVLKFEGFQWLHFNVGGF